MSTFRTSSETLRDLSPPSGVSVSPTGCYQLNVLPAERPSSFLEELTVHCDKSFVDLMTLFRDMFDFGLLLRVQLGSAMPFTRKRRVETRRSRDDIVGSISVLKRIFLGFSSYKKLRVTRSMCFKLDSIQLA